MRRILPHLAVATLLGACAAVACLWVRSHRWADVAYRQAIPVTWGVASRDGGLVVRRRTYGGLLPTAATWHYLASPSSAVGYGPPAWESAGFARGVAGGNVGLGASFRDDYWRVPYWSVLAACGCGPAAALAKRVVRRVWPGGGKCDACGYDLRATPDRCPECGTDSATRPPHNQPLQRTGGRVD